MLRSLRRTSKRAGLRSFPKRVSVSLRLGTYKTRLDYAQAIKDVEKKFKVDVIGLMPGYEEGGDPDFIAEMKGLITG